MRVLTVIGGELTPDDERDKWTLLEALVAENGPEPPEVRVMAPVTETVPVVVPGALPGQTVGVMTSQDAAGLSGYTPRQSARQRLAGTLQYLRGLGLRASGDIEPGKTYSAVHKVASAGGYGRIVLLPGNRSSWRKRMAARLMAARLRHSLRVPVQVPGPADLLPSVA